MSTIANSRIRAIKAACEHEPAATAMALVYVGDCLRDLSDPTVGDALGKIGLELGGLTAELGDLTAVVSGESQ